jgi:hypothetical protein
MVAFPGGDPNNVEKTPGDNHFQERNSPNAEILFKDLYEGKFGMFFRTPK